MGISQSLALRLAESVSITETLRTALSLMKKPEKTLKEGTLRMALKLSEPLAKTVRLVESLRKASAHGSLGNGAEIHRAPEKKIRPLRLLRRSYIYLSS